MHMKFHFTALGLLIANTAAQVLPNLSECAQSCVEGGLDFVECEDLACLCDSASPLFYQFLTSCLSQRCTDEDYEEASDALDNYDCGSSGSESGTPTATEDICDPTTATVTVTASPTVNTLNVTAAGVTGIEASSEATESADTGMVGASSSVRGSREYNKLGSWLGVLIVLVLAGNGI
ncbi:hypothetical protein MKZ38_008328 [Zalerion maritima]|uniref:CFEM domain-containing protein n=1 Tax=Zalerion maritima TaxID=339359 RepID=A0AAD5RGS5_9PEZI|nr:hypothetical protein MKZ38_008328 [Zalerion maritima]